MFSSRAQTQSVSFLDFVLWRRRKEFCVLLTLGTYVRQSSLSSGRGVANPRTIDDSENLERSFRDVKCSGRLCQLSSTELAFPLHVKRCRARTSTWESSAVRRINF